MKLTTTLSIASLLLLGVACSAAPADKEEPTDETTADLSVKSLSIAGSLDYGQTSAATSYKGGSKYVAYKFGGQAGDKVDIWVKSANGDTVAWLLDNNGTTLAKNDDAAEGNTLDSHIVFTLPASASITHYIAVRDYWRSAMSFKVTVNGAPADLAAGCNTDNDCTKVLKTCCGNLGWTAVKTGNETAYHDGLHCDEHPICPMIMTRPDYSAAECNQGTHKCELVQPKDIHCGGFINPAMQHQCPAGYNCNHAGINPDLPGKCVQFCGGIAGIACHDDTQTCVDDPSDGCDPTKGGADCGGICQ